MLVLKSSSPSLLGVSALADAWLLHLPRVKEVKAPEFLKVSYRNCPGWLFPSDQMAKIPSHMQKSQGKVQSNSCSWFLGGVACFSKWPSQVLEFETSSFWTELRHNKSWVFSGKCNPLEQVLSTGGERQHHPEPWLLLRGCCPVRSGQLAWVRPELGPQHTRLRPHWCCRLPWSLLPWRTGWLK